MSYNPHIHHRRSIRLKGYDYSGKGLYFITLCVRNRLHLFGEIEQGEMNLNAYGKIAEEEWLKTPEIRPNVALHDYIIMPNHFHAILEIRSQHPRGTTGKPKAEFKSPSQTIGAIIRGFKGATTKRVKELIYNGAGELQFARTASAPAPSQFAPGESAIIKKLDLSKSIWQRDYYDIIIRSEKAYINISNYIRNNPEKWSNDNFNRRKPPHI